MSKQINKLRAVGWYCWRPRVNQAKQVVETKTLEYVERLIGFKTVRLVLFDLIKIFE